MLQEIKDSARDEGKSVASGLPCTQLNFGVLQGNTWRIQSIAVCCWIRVCWRWIAAKYLEEDDKPKHLTVVSCWSILFEYVGVC